MSGYSITEPSKRQKWLAGILVISYAIITLLPLIWIVSTGFKSSPDSIAYPPKVLFEPTVEGYVNLFTTQTRQTCKSRSRPTMRFHSACARAPQSDPYAIKVR